MIHFISHRGNISGPIPDKENSPDYIEKALSLGFEVEIDVWYVSKSFYLGHDEPKYLVSKSFLKNKKLWCHAKSQFGLIEMLKEDIHCFWHQKDDVTLTSKNYIWAYPGKLILKNGIDVMPENIKGWKVEKYNPVSSGVCSDFIQDIFKRWNNE